MKIFSTLSRKIETFKSITPKKVGMYVCGPTPYDKSHVGHARTYIFFDFFRRFLEYKGYDVNYIINLTDIDDKIIKRARETKKHWQEIPDKFSKYFIQMLKDLKIKMPTAMPSVTTHMQEIIEFVSELLDKEIAYTAKDGIYFDITKFKDYGKLSRVNLNDDAIHRIEPVADKRNPQDFAIWKFKKKDEPFWFAPFGEGRPGWHIECSAMSRSYLGERFDIHGGGADLIFPHHENELAQSEVLIGEKWVNYWMHVAYLTIDKTKMSKSLGNFISMDEILETFKPEVLRFYLLSAHYRTQLNFTWDKLKKANEQWDKISRAYLDVIQRSGQKLFGKDDITKEVKLEVANMIDALDTDLKTPEAFKYINFIASLVLSNDLNQVSTEVALEAFKVIEDIFGILPNKSWTKREATMAEDMAGLREEFRKLKRFDLTDKIRNQLDELGIVVEDTEKGPKVKFKA